MKFTRSLGPGIDTESPLDHDESVWEALRATVAATAPPSLPPLANGAAARAAVRSGEADRFPGAKVHPTAIVEEDVTLGQGTSVWDNAHIRHGASIGEECIIGGKSYIAYDVEIGNRVKINASVYICAQVTIEDGVMISAGTTFTNDKFPRAASSDLKRLRSSDPDETTLSTRVCAGATIGAGAIIGCDLEIGRFAVVGMGSVVTRSVPPFRLVMGHPARSVACVCRCGQKLLSFPEQSDCDDVACVVCGLLYSVRNGVVIEWTPPA